MENGKKQTGMYRRKRQNVIPGDSGYRGNYPHDVSEKGDQRGNDSLIIEKRNIRKLILQQRKTKKSWNKDWKSSGLWNFHLEEYSGSMRTEPGGAYRIRPDLTKIDVVRYTTGGEKPVINRVKTVDGERNFIQNLKAEKVRDGYRAKGIFDWKEERKIHGLGQAEEGIYNYRGHNQYLYQHNMRIPMPLFVSTEGYGVLFDCCSS